MEKKIPLFPSIVSDQLTGNESINGNTTLLDYWRWAHSNLVDNTERGVFAEFLVHMAVGATSKTRTNWDNYDILSPEGIRIEVKASGYIQSWAQEKLSAISFSVRSTYGWDAETNQYLEECARQSDVYVFCLHKHVEQETINILDVNQWTFFVLPTSVLNAKAGNQKTITLNGIRKLGAVETDYEALHKTICRLAGKELYGSLDGG